MAQADACARLNTQTHPCAPPGRGFVSSDAIRPARVYKFLVGGMEVPPWPPQVVREGFRVGLNRCAQRKQSFSTGIPKQELGNEIKAWKAQKSISHKFINLNTK